MRTIDDASDAGSDMPGLIRALIAEFRHLLVARVNPELLARDLAADDAAAAAVRAQTVPQARIVRALRLFGDALGAINRSADRLFGLREIDDTAGLGAARRRMAEPNDFDGVRPPCQNLLRRMRPQPGDHACDLA